MLQREFWKILIGSALISSALVLFFLRWPAPLSTQAEFKQIPDVELRSHLTDEENINIQIYKSLSRGVVNVTTTKLEYTWFFEVIPSEGVGSGVVFDKKGHILTNYHVIRDAQRLEVTLYDKSKYQAEVLGVDPINDIALLKIKGAADTLFPIKLGQSNILEVGQKVLAIGNPFGLEGTLTTGIISSLGRKLKTKHGFIDELIQTDASINPGNSGGPLLNTQGEMIGINTAIYSQSGDSAGIGFAVPSSTLLRIIPDLLQYGKVRRPWFGAQGLSLTYDLAKALELPVEQGLLLQKVQQGSSADMAGLRGGHKRIMFRNSVFLIGGDIILSMGDQEIQSLGDLISVLENKRPGEKISIVFLRNKKKISKTMELIGDNSEQRFRF